MHEIQKDILKKLSLQKKIRYSDLKDKEVEGNVFVYHLNSLTKLGLIISKDKTYSLTSAGKHLISRMSFDTFEERTQPKIVTSMVIEKDGKYLLYRQKRAPFINFVSFPYGKIHLEERIKDSAERELKEKSGLSAKLKHRGDVYIAVHDETELVTHLLCHVFSGTEVTGELEDGNTVGECFWGTFDEIDSKNILPGAKKILKLVKENKKDHFFAEYFLNTTDEE
ncbi:MAG: NUDIX domain-containing protein [Candidatus Paceibacterota bacterium]